MDVDIHLDMADARLQARPRPRRRRRARRKSAAKAKAKADAATKAFNEGVALSNDGKTDEAIAKFNEVLAAIPNCAECYANIGTVQTRGQEVRRGRSGVQEGDRAEA